MLALDHVSLHRADRCLAQGLCLTVEPGEAVHLRGANGVGKTTLLETLAGLREPGQGQLRRPGSLHWLGHRNGLSPALSVTQNLVFWCGLNAADPAGLRPALERLAIWPLRGRAVRSLSAGQKRRAALARLLLQDRPLWLLDEPLDGLDAAGLQCVAGLLREHLGRGGAAIITSHQPIPPEAGRIREWTLP
jgi:heme exporter protein A